MCTVLPIEWGCWQCRIWWRVTWCSQFARK